MQESVYKTAAVRDTSELKQRLTDTWTSARTTKHHRWSCCQWRFLVHARKRKDI